MQFFHWKFAANSVIKNYSKTLELWTHLDWSFEFFNNFQTRQIQARNQYFSGEKRLLLCGSRFMKKIFFSGKKIERNLFCHLKKTSKLWRAWSLAQLVHNVFSYLHFLQSGWDNVVKIWAFDATSRVYSSPILRSIPCLISNAAPFCENYTRLYFDVKH